jgi:acetyltransferase-like isoleucine patch superfamily enzyme
LLTLDEEKYIRQKLFANNKSLLEKYSELVLGKYSFWGLIKYEIITSILGPFPGALGLFLRKIFYPTLFREVGKGVVFGRNIVIRSPQNISLGNQVLIDDYSVIDARGAGDKGVVIGDQVIINRSSSIQAKLGEITIGSFTDIGMFSVVHSQGGVYIGEMVTLGGGCKISGGRFQVNRTANDEEEAAENFALREQMRFSSGPIKIKSKSILGMGAIVLDGVEIGEGCVIGAGSVVIENIPEYSVAAGSPAKVIKKR